MVNNEIVLANPGGSVAKAQDLIAYIDARRDDVLRQIADADAAIDATNYDSAETRAELTRLGEIVEDLREGGKRLVRRVCEDTEAQRVLTAIDARLWSYSSKVDPASAYGRISAAYRVLKAKVAAFRAANAPAMPVRACALVLYATDKGVADLCARIKAGAVGGIKGYCTAQDEATEKKAVKLIETRNER